MKKKNKLIKMFRLLTSFCKPVSYELQHNLEMQLHSAAKFEIEFVLMIHLINLNHTLNNAFFERQLCATNTKK